MRNFPNWLQAYCEYSQNTEAPERMRMWCGISAIAGALRRKVWIDMAYFQWYADQYVYSTSRRPASSRSQPQLTWLCACFAKCRVFASAQTW